MDTREALITPDLRASVARGIQQAFPAPRVETLLVVAEYAIACLVNHGLHAEWLVGWLESRVRIADQRFAALKRGNEDH